ncbi:MAG: hypothetical protein QGD92_05405 [Gammaproteobacteria bacterium]|nr:hypothetical protein [Gammaproteobacteria bacterium]
MSSTRHASARAMLYAFLANLGIAIAKPLGYGKLSYFWSFIVARMLFAMDGPLHPTCGC